MRKATVSFVMSICPSAWNKSAPNGRIFMKLDIWAFFENLSRILTFNWNPIRITGTLHDVSTFLTISRSILLRMGNILDKTCGENENTHFIFRNFFRKLHRLWHNSEKYGGDREATYDVTIWRTRVACWISKATCTYSHLHTHTAGYQYARTHRSVRNTYCFFTGTVICERASVVHYTYIACLGFCVLFCFVLFHSKKYVVRDYVA